VRDEDIGLGAVKLWNDLSWDHPKPEVADGEFLQISNETEEIPLNPLAGNENEQKPQRDEDLNIHWNEDMSSADLAYILYQVPVLVAIHATEMLPRD
jgi:hypothetical protein